MDNILALEYAKTQGCSEVLFLNLKDEICCFSIGNILLEMHDGKWLSPSPESGCIQGIMLKNLPQHIQYAPLTMEHVKKAKNIYRTNSVSGLWPVLF